MCKNNDQSILDLLGNGKEAQILREGLQALHRERVQALNVLSSMASKCGNVLPSEEDFEIPMIEKMIRRVGGTVMTQLPTRIIEPTATPRRFDLDEVSSMLSKEQASNK